MIRRLFRCLCALTVILTGLFFASAAPAYAGEVQGAPSFTAEEREYIASHKKLRVGYVQDRVPISFSDENGELAGLSRYIFDRVSELCGIEFEYVPIPSGDITYDYLIGEGFDLVTSVESNEENRHARGVLVSEPYFSSRKVIVAREDLNFRYDADLSVAISTGSQTLRTVLNEMYPHFQLIDYDSIEDCLDAVNSGRADLMIQNQYIVEYWFSKPIYEKLKVIPIPGLDEQLCFSAVVAFGDFEGPSSEDGAVLIGILNKAIAAMSADEVGTYTIQAIMENQYSFSFSDFMYRYRYAAAILITAVIIIVVLTILLAAQRVRAVKNTADTKAREQFLSTMSHEIRTPLNGLIGLNGLMARKLDDRKQMEKYLHQSTVTANYLLSLVNDILDMSKLQTHQLELILRPLNLGLLLDTVNSIVKGAMDEKKQVYTVRSELDFPYILGDEVRLQQILLNLLDNACKFTSAGGRIDLSVRQEMTGGGSVLTTVTVSDTGRGMTEEFQKHIFDTFAQELDTVSKGNQGTGLGLSISHSLALLMGGSLTCTSRKDVGSACTFAFPAKPAAPPEKKEAAPHIPQQHPRILVVEDNELNGEIILDLLADEGFETVLAENGKKALQLFEKSAPGTFGVILMDLLMPEMDGFEAARSIRALHRPDAKTVRILACSANASSEDREKALASGMDGFIPKPVNAGELLKKIQE